MTWLAALSTSEQVILAVLIWIGLVALLWRLNAAIARQRKRDDEEARRRDALSFDDGFTAPERRRLHLIVRMGGRKVS